MFKNKNILITGGSGTLGQGLLERLTEFKRLVVFSRSQTNQHELMSLYPKVEFVLGDIRDILSVKRAVTGMDIVIHAAAFKYIDIGEQQPRECVMTNILGSLNILEAVEEAQQAEVCLGISTDKAIYPTSVYGCTKHIMEKLFSEANRRSRKTKYCCIRYGNIKNSVGSVFSIWQKQKDQGLPITLTDPNMTRFFSTVNEMVSFIFYTINNTKGGEVFVKQLPSFKMGDLANSYADGKKIKIIGVRKGEKLHETLVADYEGEEYISGVSFNEGKVIILKL